VAARVAAFAELSRLESSAVSCDFSVVVTVSRAVPLFAGAVLLESAEPAVSSAWATPDPVIAAAMPTPTAPVTNQA